MTQEIAQLLDVSLRLWLRCAPLFLLTPYLAFGAFPLLWGSALSWAFAGSLAPLVAAGCRADSACAAALGGGQLLTWGLALSELLAGVVVALGFGLPFVAFRTLGSIAQGLAAPASTAASGGSQLGRAASLLAAVSAVSAGALSGVSQWLLALPLPAAEPLALHPNLFRSLSQELVRAFELGTSLAGPLLLGAIFAAIFVGLWVRIAGARALPVGPLLLPWLGIALVSLCVASWLDSVPELVRAFAQSSARLLNGVP